MRELENYLHNFGFTRNEAKVYMTLLLEGESAASHVAVVSGINRSTVYIVLESLKKKGLIQINTQFSPDRFTAMDPQVIAEMAEKRAQEQVKVSSAISKALPLFRASDKSNRYRPNVEVYEGTNELRQVYDDVLNYRDTELLVYADATKMMKFMTDLEQTSIRRIKQGTKMRAINPKTIQTPIMIKKVKLPGDEIIFVPRKSFKFDSDLAIYGNRVALASISEEFGIIIDSPHIASSMKAQFELMWEAAQKIGLHHQF